MTSKLKNSIIKSNLAMGRPRGEEKRRVRLMWPVEIADAIEEHRDWIERNIDIIARYSNEIKDADAYQKSDGAKESRAARKRTNDLFDKDKRGER